MIDSDEYYTKKAFDYGLQQIDEHDYEMTYCQYVNYYHDYMHYLKYPFAEGMYVPWVSKTKYRHSFDCKDFPHPSDPTRRYVRTEVVKDANGRDVRKVIGEFHIFQWNEVKMHHLSWLRADIRKKLENWSSKKMFKDYDDLIDRAVLAFENFDENDNAAQALMLFNTPDNKVDVTSFPRQFIHPVADFKTRLRPAKDYKKVLFLSMSADKEPFNSLEKVCNETWRNVDHIKYPDVNAEFWTYTEAVPGKGTTVDRENHIIYIDTPKFKDEKDTFNRTYSKTIEVLRILRDKLKIDYDYIVRTNNSTWLNVPLICEFLAYIHDDSMVYGGKLYSGYFSAFNIYMGGQMMIWSARNVNVILSICGSVKDARAFEERFTSSDDNAIGAKLNARSIKLKIPYERTYHTLGEDDYTAPELELPAGGGIDFSCPAHQIKTAEVSVEDRIKFDSAKMRTIDRMWRECDESVDDLYHQLMEKWYDKTISVMPDSKAEWFKRTEAERRIQRYNSEMERSKALEFLEKRQVELGYMKGCFRTQKN